MSNSNNIPDWATEGPEDFEYRRYRMLSHVSETRKKLKLGKLWESLQETDAALDFLYQYDAERYLIEENTKSTQLTNVNWNNIESLYNTGSQIISHEIIDDLIDDAIDAYETLHSDIRENWRTIDQQMSIGHAGTKPYLITSGFVLIYTPDKKLHTYSFNNPKINNNIDWKGFTLYKISTQKYDKKSTIEYISEIKDKDSEKIIYNVHIKNVVMLDEGPINVIASNIFMQLRKDYGI